MKVSDILERAADRLSKPGAWCQVLRSGESNPGGQCAANMICEITSDDVPLRRDAAAVFSRHIGGAGHMADIWTWNDAPGRTQAEVVAKLREAAAKAREQGK